MSPAIDRLERLGFLRLTAETLPWLITQEHALILLTGNPERVREANDAAVIFPDLVQSVGQAAGVKVSGGFLTPDQETDAVRAELGVLAYPSVVVYRAGKFAGVVPGLKAWSEYVEKVSAFLAPAA